MAKLLLLLLLTGSLSLPASAIPVPSPAEPIACKGKVIAIEPLRYNWDDVAETWGIFHPAREFLPKKLIIGNVEELDKEEAKQLHRILAKLSPFQIRRPARDRAEFVFPDTMLAGLKPGDPVEISGYQIVILSPGDLKSTSLMQTAKVTRP